MVAREFENFLIFFDQKSTFYGIFAKKDRHNSMQLQWNHANSNVKGNAKNFVFELRSNRDTEGLITEISTKKEAINFYELYRHYIILTATYRVWFFKFKFHSINMYNISRDNDILFD